MDRRRYLETGGGSLMAKKWNMIVDVERCDNCRNCFLAVKDEHIGNDFPGYAASQPEHEHSWLDIERKERGSYPIVDASFMPVMCNHCDDAPCMKVAKERRHQKACRRHRDHRSRKNPKVRKRSWMPARMVRCTGTRKSRSRRHGFSMRTCWMTAGRKPGQSNAVRPKRSGPSRSKIRKCSGSSMRRVWKSCSRNSGPNLGCITRTCI